MADEVIGFEETRHVAKLARIELTDDELHGLTRDLGSILTYVKKLDELDTTSVEPTTHAVELQTKLRDDTSSEGLDVELGLRGAPERLGDGFGVPKIIE